MLFVQKTVMCIFVGNVSFDCSQNSSFLRGLEGNRQTGSLSLSVHTVFKHFYSIWHLTLGCCSSDSSGKIEYATLKSSLHYVSLYVVVIMTTSSLLYIWGISLLECSRNLNCFSKTCACVCGIVFYAIFKTLMLGNKVKYN
jgi:hypothetical protein